MKIQICDISKVMNNYRKHSSEGFKLQRNDKDENLPLFMSLLEASDKGLNYWLESLSDTMLEYGLRYTPNYWSTEGKDDNHRQDIMATTVYLVAFRSGSDQINSEIEDLMHQSALIEMFLTFELLTRMGLASKIKYIGWEPLSIGTSTIELSYGIFDLLAAFGEEIKDREHIKVDVLAKMVGNHIHTLAQLFNTKISCDGKEYRLTDPQSKELFLKSYK